jgi:DNA-binding CsgD family transcriptional regulator
MSVTPHMAHSKITVDNLSGPRDLSVLFEVAAELGVSVHTGRVGPRRAVLELEPDAPVEALAHALAERGLHAMITPGEHLVDSLSRREQELIVHLTAGLQLKEVAQRMGVQTHTAREYWLRVKRKWDVKTVGQAVRIWTEQAHEHDEAPAAETASGG